MTVIRPAAPTDADDMAEVQNAIYRAGLRSTPVDVEQIRERYLDQTYGIACPVAEQDGRVIGSQSLKRAWPDNSYDVAEELRRRDEELNDGEIPQMPAGNLKILSLTDGTPDCATMKTVELTGIAEVAADDPEPEFVAFNEAGEIAVTLQEILALAGHVIVGGIIITAGVLIGGVFANLINKGTGGADGFASTLVRWATIALATAMGLRFMGIADDIVLLAFGLILGAAAVAAALAFGLGGRDAASKVAQTWADKVTKTPPQ